MDDPRDLETTRDTPEAAFGVELRRLRERAGLTVRALAAELHRAHSGIVEYETGQRLPGIDVVEQYEAYFEQPSGQLLAQRERARAQRLDDPRDATTAHHLGDVPCPYVGLRAFQLDDSAVFFGREHLVDEVLARLVRSRFAAVVGASGSGKSSFVHAGLLAAIAATSRADGPRVAALTPGRHPLAALAAACGTLDGAAPRHAPSGLRRLVESPRTGAGGPGLVLVVDQLEELFTLCYDEDERRAFVAGLLDAWRDPASPVTIILALRSDHYGRVAAYPELAAVVVAEQALLGPMSPRDLRRAIELPAAKAGLLLQAGLAETMLDDLGAEPGALPLLAHALFETWKRRRRLTLTVGGYREAGGVRGAIAQTAERTMQGLQDADRAIVRSVFLRLSDITEGAEPGARRIARAELAAAPASAGGVDRVIGILADARLVTLDAGTVAVTHEAVIRHWPRLRGWIDADRAGLLVHQGLTRAAAEWESLAREPGALLRGTRLAVAREWAADHSGDLSRLERAFLSTSATSERREVEAARRRGRRLHVLAGGLAALATIVGVLAAWAMSQRATARRAAREATSLTLAAAAAKLGESHPDAGLLLAFEAYRASSRAEARGTVVDALLAARGPRAVAVMRDSPGGGASIAFSPDGRTLASASADHAIRIHDVARRVPLGTPLTGHAGTVTSIAFSPDGRTLATASADRTIRLWDVHAREQLGSPLTQNARGVSGLAFLNDGRTLVSAGTDRTIRLWDVRTHAPQGAPLTLADFVAVFAGRVRMLSSDLAVAPEALDPSGGSAATLASNLLTVAIGAPDGSVRLRDARTLEQVGAPLAAGKAPARDFAFSGDGRTLASAATDGTIRLWDVATHRQLGLPLAGRGGVPAASVRFSPDDRSLAGGGGGRIRLWERILWRDAEELRGEVCRLAGGGLSRTAWAQYAVGVSYRRSCS